mmetsp:Transcript_68845/g.153647  ORF Transcript_68845/g.153647 Transcript_68845/m.153647 type:complete len:97 (-) Transcript_68845:644-934(-)
MCVCALRLHLLRTGARMGGGAMDATPQNRGGKVQNQLNVPTWCASLESAAAFHSRQRDVSPVKAGTAHMHQQRTTPSCRAPHSAPCSGGGSCLSAC